MYSLKYYIQKIVQEYEMEVESKNKLIEEIQEAIDEYLFDMIRYINTVSFEDLDEDEIKTMIIGIISEYLLFGGGRD